MEWIPAKQDPDGTILINQLRFSDRGDNRWGNSDENDKRLFRYHAGYLYIEDSQHSGYIYVSDEVMKKYSIGSSPDTEFEAIMDDDDFEYLSELFGSNHSYTHWICINHCRGTVNGNGEEYCQLSPQGDTSTDSFVAWWNGFDPGLLEEPESQVFRSSWFDG